MEGFASAADQLPSRISKGMKSWWGCAFLGHCRLCRLVHPRSDSCLEHRYEGRVPVTDLCGQGLEGAEAGPARPPAGGLRCPS